MEEDNRIGLQLNQLGFILTKILDKNTLEKKQLDQSHVLYFDFINVVEEGFSISLNHLFLNRDTSLVVLGLFLDQD